MTTLFPLPDTERISPLKTRLYLLGLPAFTIDIHGTDLVSYVNERFHVLSAAVENVSDNESIISVSFISRAKGAAIDASSIPCYKQYLKPLINQDCCIPISANILDQVGSLVNMHSYSTQRSPEIFIANFYAVHMMMSTGKRRKLSHPTLITNNRTDLRDRIVLNDICIDSLRFRCSKITMLPFIFEDSFMIAVLLTENAKAYVLSCKVEINHSNIIAIKVSNLLLLLL